MTKFTMTFFSPIGNWTLKVKNLGSSKQNEGLLKHFQIRLHGTGYDQYDVECPQGQVYDLVHFLCIDYCTVGTYQRPPPVNFRFFLFEKLKFSGKLRFKNRSMCPMPQELYQV